MGYAYNVELPAVGSADPIVPINVCGQTIFGGEGIFQVAYDEAGYNSNQFGMVTLANGQVILHFDEPTVLYVRQDPSLIGAPATPLYVWTKIGRVSV